MAQQRDLSKAQLAFQVSGRDIDEFLVVRFRGTEGLCQLYRFEIDLVTTQEGNLLAPIVGKPAVLSVNTQGGERWFHGIVSRFEMTGETVGQTYFRAELVPAVWLLTHRYCSRIFQNKNVKEIITEVLDQGGIPSDRFDMTRLTADYETREYCVQYRETDYNFISRLMEEESIWWYFEQSQDKHVMVMAEKRNDYAPIRGDADLNYHPPTGMKVEEEHVYRFRIAQSVRPGAVVINDYNFENPPLNLESRADNARDPGLVFSDFPGKHLSQARGSTLATNHALEFETNRVTALGQSNCTRLAPGRTFNLIEHPSAGFNGSYVVTRITHQGKESVTRTTTGPAGRTRILDGRAHQSLIAARGNDNPAIRELAESLLQIASRLEAGDPTANRSLTHWLYHAGQVSKDLPSTAVASGGNPLEWLSIPNLISDLASSSVVDFDAPVYDCNFECLPASVTYIPARITPWPVMRGTQTARVVGPEGEEIQVDRYGRVRVQFDWDLQGFEAGQAKRFGADSSCWIRVCQGWAGGQYGIMFIPRVGQEVVVDFLEGDPDKPIIIGRVFNADHMPPYELPKEKTKSVIKTRSSKGGGGANEIRFEDLKDKEQLFIQAQRQMDTRVKASHFHTVGSSYHVIVGGEKDGELHGGYLQLVHKEKRTHVKDYREMWIEGDEQYFVDINQSIFVEGDHLQVVQGNVRLESRGRNIQASTYSLLADTIQIKANMGIELVCGASSIVLTPAGIYINGPMVYINSGAGPAQPAAPNVPSPPTTELGPSPADSSQPGRDTRYDAPNRPPPELPPQPEVPGHEFPEEEPPAPRTSWIEIQVVDESGDPVANERVNVTLPGGQVRQARTNSSGMIRVDGIAAGQCQISLPNRDADAWENA